MQKRFMLLGSGELGKEFVIAAQRLGQYVMAVDKYEGAPAMQVAHESAVIDMLDGEQLEKVINEFKPDYIVPEIEAIRTEKLYEFEEKGITVVPSAKAVNYTMDRKAIRDLAHDELQLKTAPYAYASSLNELKDAAAEIGFPAVIKPLMSSSGKGQSVVKSNADLEKAWNYAQEGGRGDKATVIIEGFINFHTEITLLTLTQQSGLSLVCPPIGHIQKDGDYRESWQPASIDPNDLKQAEKMAIAVAESLGGNGIWGVEFFIADDGVYFSELSPRPHDTGMVSLAGSQNFNEFELHLRAILGLPVDEIKLEAHAASCVILSNDESGVPKYLGFEEASSIDKGDFKIFGKPEKRMNRRMGVALAKDYIGIDMDVIRERARKVASKIKVE